MAAMPCYWLIQEWKSWRTCWFSKILRRDCCWHLAAERCHHATKTSKRGVDRWKFGWEFRRPRRFVLAKAFIILFTWDESISLLSWIASIWFCLSNPWRRYSGHSREKIKYHIPRCTCRFQRCVNKMKADKVDSLCFMKAKQKTWWCTKYKIWIDACENRHCIQEMLRCSAPPVWLATVWILAQGTVHS